MTNDQWTVRERERERERETDRPIEETHRQSQRDRISVCRRLDTTLLFLRIILWRWGLLTTICQLCIILNTRSRKSLDAQQWKPRNPARRLSLAKRMWPVSLTSRWGYARVYCVWFSVCVWPVCEFVFLNTNYFVNQKIQPERCTEYQNAHKFWLVQFLHDRPWTLCTSVTDIAHIKTF